MIRIPTPVLAGLLVLVTACSHTTQSYPSDSRGAPEGAPAYARDDLHGNGTYSPARRALRMRSELRLSGPQVERLVLIERDYGSREVRSNGNGRGRGRGNGQARRGIQEERRDVDRVLTREQRRIFQRR